jgi:transposase
MIDMVDKNQILINYYRDGESKSSIARRLKISRKTVRRCIEEHEQIYRKTLSKDLLEKGITSKPEYDISGREPLKLSFEIKNKIEECLSLNREKNNKGLHKQQMKKIDIYELLKSEGFVIGYTTVCNYIRSLEHKESFIKQIYAPGHTCEFDWCDVKLYFNGKLQVLNLAVFVNGYSNYRWGKLFYKQDTLAFSQSHIDFFEHIKGVPKEMVYDNMRVAIRKFVGHFEKQATVCLLELSTYYKFGFRFCNIRKGNEKGHVERSVEYVRRKAFSNDVDFTDIAQANAHLWEIIEKLNNTPQQLVENKTANELFAEEKSYLYQTNIAYISFETLNSKADKYATVIVYGNRYSSPDFLVGKLISIRIFAEKIDTYYNTQNLGTHIRSYGAHTWTLDINHYLTTLFRKPGALKNSVAFNQSDEKIKHIYQEYFTDDNREFIELLQYCKDKNTDIKNLEKAIHKLNQICGGNISKDKIIAVIEKAESTEIKQNTDDEIHRYSQALLNELAAIYN